MSASSGSPQSTFSAALRRAAAAQTELVTSPPPPSPVTAGRRLAEFARTPVCVMLGAIAAAFVLLMVMQPPFVFRPGSRWYRTLGRGLLASFVTGAVAVSIPLVTAEATPPEAPPAP